MRRLFKLFCSILWREGMTKARALWQAKLVLRSEGHTLRNRAAWVLTGDPR